MQRSIKIKHWLAIFVWLSLVGVFVASVRLTSSAAAPRAATDAITQVETRCGWFDNPTPANISLFDREGEWIIGVQGGYQVEGDWEWPDFKPGQFVKTNVNYGYGCACLQVRVNRAEGEIVEIKSAKARPLATCRRDPALKKWRSQFK